MKWQEIKQTARDLRRIETEEEAIMWNVLRNRKVDNLKFNRQFPIIYETINNEHFFFVADFYCHKFKLVVEIDGEIHKKQKDYDEGRTAEMENYNIKVIRFTNDQVLNNTDWVVEEIKKHLDPQTP